MMVEVMQLENPGFALITEDTEQFCAETFVGGEPW